MFVVIADMSFEVANQMAGFEGSQSGILTGHNRNFHSVIYIRFFIVPFPLLFLPLVSHAAGFLIIKVVNLEH